MAKMSVPFFALGRRIAGQKTELMSSLEEVLDSGVYIGGPSVEIFEESFSRYVGTSYCVGVGNGLDALRIILEAHAIGPGDEVIVPGFTFFATWLAVMQTGAKPVAVDVSLETAGIDASLIEAAITPRTKAVIAVHLFGVSVDMSAVRTVSLKNGLFLFEDAAQAHGGATNIGNVGNSSDAAAFSFYPTKNLGALGDAGAITTNKPELFDKMKSLRSYGVGQLKTDHVSLGWNSRLDPIQAALLSTLLPSLADSNRVRKRISETYLSALRGNSLVAVLSPNSQENVFHHFVVRDLSRIRLESRAFLAERGIETDVHYPYSFSEVPAIISHFKKNNWALPELPNSKKLAAQVISLPIGPWMSPGEIKLVADALTELGTSPG